MLPSENQNSLGGDVEESFGFSTVSGSCILRCDMLSGIMLDANSSGGAMTGDVATLSKAILHDLHNCSGWRGSGNIILPATGTSGVNASDMKVADVREDNGLGVYRPRGGGGQTGALISILPTSEHGDEI